MRGCTLHGHVCMMLNQCNSVSAVTCPIEAVDNAEIYPANQDHINFDTSAIYVCNNGYAKTEGDNIRKCEANKQLSGEPLICSSMYVWRLLTF